jgi:flagellar basal body-associated protein FliL
MGIFNKFLRNKKGSGWIWIYGLAFLFAIGLVYALFLYVFEGHLIPIIQEVTNDSTTIDAATKAEINSGIDKYMTFFKLIPFILFFVVVIYMIASTIFKQSGGNYYG